MSTFWTTCGGYIIIGTPLILMIGIFSTLFALNKLKNKMHQRRIYKQLRGGFGI